MRRSASAGCILPRRCRIARWRKVGCRRRERLSAFTEIARCRVNATINPPVTPFLYALRTISAGRCGSVRVRGAYMLRLSILSSVVPLVLAGGVAHDWSAVSARQCAAAGIIAPASRSVAFTDDPLAATVRVQIVESAELADLAIADDVEWPRRRRAASMTWRGSSPSARSPVPGEAVIHLTREAACGLSHLRGFGEDFGADGCRPARQRARRAHDAGSARRRTSHRLAALRLSQPCLQRKAGSRLSSSSSQQRCAILRATLCLSGKRAQ